MGNEFKIGDNVKYIGCSKRYIGSEGVVTSIIDSKYVVTTFSDKALPGIFVGNIEKHEIQNTDLTNLVKEYNAIK